jgi:hypothetical protein
VFFFTLVSFSAPAIERTLYLSAVLTACISAILLSQSTQFAFQDVENMGACHASDAAISKNPLSSVIVGFISYISPNVNTLQE